MCVCVCVCVSASTAHRNLIDSYNSQKEHTRTCGGASALEGSSVQCIASTFTSEIYIVKVIGMINMIVWVWVGS